MFLYQSFLFYNISVLPETFVLVSSIVLTNLF